jgi:trigger factor
MQVTETLSDGLKRAWSVVVPAADIDARREKRLAELLKRTQKWYERKVSRFV